MKVIELADYHHPDWTDLFIDTLHKAIADKLADKPQLLGIVCFNLRVWKRQCADPKGHLRQWKRIVYTWELADIVAFLKDPSPTARELRRFSPFCGLLNAAEIAAIWSEAVLNVGESAGRHSA